MSKREDRIIKLIKDEDINVLFRDGILIVRTEKPLFNTKDGVMSLEVNAKIDVKNLKG